MTELSFHPVRLEDREAVRAACLASGTMSCQYNFASLYFLCERYETEIATTKNGVLLVRQHMRSPGRVAYLPPLGLPWPRLLTIARADYRPWYLFGVTGQDKAELGQCEPDALRFTEDRDWAEYLYPSEQMVTLPGERLGQRRRDAQACREAYGNRMVQETITAANLEEVYDFQTKWLKRREDCRKMHPYLSGENEVIRKALNHFDELDLKGLLLRIDGQIVGYTYGCAVGDQAFVILTQKTDIGVKHLSRVIFQDVAKEYGLAYPWINMEEDIGVPGLRRMKSIYQPVLLEKWLGEPVDA